MNLSSVHTVFTSAALLICVAAVRNANSAEIEGFTEPYKTVNVAAADPGIVTKIPVRVGDFVKQGDVVAKLDDDLHTIMVGKAEDDMIANGKMDAANAKLLMRETRYEKLLEIEQNGFGRKEEVDRAAKELDVAKADLQAEREDQIQRRWELQKLREQLKRRTVVAPISGYIAQTLKEPGEFVAPNEPNVVTIVQLDPLLAKFSLKRSTARKVKIGDEFTVTVSGGTSAKGVVDSISPIIDAQSGTQKIKIKIANPNGRILSGERCRINLPYDEGDDDPEKMALDSLPRKR